LKKKNEVPRPGDAAPARRRLLPRAGQRCLQGAASQGEFCLLNEERTREGERGSRRGPSVRGVPFKKKDKRRDGQRLIFRGEWAGGETILKQKQSLRIGTLEIVDGWRVDPTRDREEQARERLALSAAAAAAAGSGRSKRTERARAAAAAAAAAAATASASASSSPAVEAYRFVTRPNIFDFVPEKARAR